MGLDERPGSIRHHCLTLDIIVRMVRNEENAHAQAKEIWFVCQQSKGKGKLCSFSSKLWENQAFNTSIPNANRSNIGRFGLFYFEIFSLSPWNKSLSKWALTKNVIHPSCSLVSRKSGDRRLLLIVLFHNIIIQICMAKMCLLFICWLLQFCSLFFSQQSWKLYLEKLTSSLNIHYSSRLVEMSCWNTCHLLNFSGKKWHRRFTHGYI